MQAVSDKLASGEQPPAQELSNVEQASPVNEENALVLHASMENSLEVNTLEKKVTDDEPLVKKLKFLLPTPSSILSPTPLNSILPVLVQKPDDTTMTIEQFTEHISKNISSIFSPTPPRELTPPRYPPPTRDESKGKGIVTEVPLKEIMPFMKEGEMKRLADLKAEKEKFAKSLKKILNPATIRAQAQKMAESATDSSKEATMRITRGNDPLNLTVYERFRLKTLGFSKWLEVHALASKTKSKSNDLLLQSLEAKFQWVLSQGKALGIPPPHELSTFGVSINEKKRRKSSKILKEVFMKEDVVVDGMHRNLVRPLRVKGRKGLVIREPEYGIFFYNGNFDLVFQREEEFHQATTAQLIRLQNAIKRGSPDA
ncbi:hypothetical protein Tco_0791788 [Tanacetum coccineum]